MQLMWIIFPIVNQYGVFFMEFCAHTQVSNYDNINISLFLYFLNRYEYGFLLNWYCFFIGEIGV